MVLYSGRNIKQFDETLNRVADLVLAVGLASALLLFGGRHPWGEAAIILTAILAAGITVFCLRRDHAAWTGAEILIFGVTALLVFQLCPLPQHWLEVLSPKVKQWLPAWQWEDTARQLGTWSTLSLYPAQTRVGLALWLAFGLLFLATAYRVRYLHEVHRFFRILTWLAVGLSLFGLLQYLFSNGKFFWLYEHPFSHTRDAVKASFTNRNHFAQLVALTSGPLLWWLFYGHGSAAANGGRGGRTFSSQVPLETVALRWLPLPVVMIALLLTFSRGGITAALVAAVVTGLALCWTRAIRGHGISVMIVALMIVAAGIVVVGPQKVTARWEAVFDLQWTEIDRGQARTSVWLNTWRAAQDFWLTGSGVGTFSVVYPTYRNSRDSNLYYTHAENSYLQILLELGWPGVIFAILGLGLAAHWTWRGLRRAGDPSHRAAVAVIAGSLLAFALHGLVDYVWYVPALAALVSVMLGYLVALSRPSTGPVGCQKNTSPCVPQATGHSYQNQTMPSQKGWGPVFTLAGTLLVLLPIEFPLVWERYQAGWGEMAWHRFLLLRKNLDPAVLAGGNEAANPGPTSCPPENLQSVEAGEVATQNLGNMLPSEVSEQVTSHGTADQDGSVGPHHFQGENASGLAGAKTTRDVHDVISLLKTVVRYQPGRAEAQLELARAYLLAFHQSQGQCPNPMPLSQVRDAAIHASFISREDLHQWLQTAFGDHVHLLDDAAEAARLACRLCPMLGEAYFILGQVSFLDLGKEDTLCRWFEQSLAVRPHDGDLLFRLGAEYTLLGREVEGFTLWQRAFACGPYYRERLLRFLVGRSPEPFVDQEIAFLLETFEPDLDSMRLMYRLYRRIRPLESLGRLQRAYAAALQSQLAKEETSPAVRSELWLEAHFLYRDMGDISTALSAAQQAVRCDPANYRSRYYLAKALEDVGQFAEAEEHLRWCVQRRPGHRALLKRLEDVMRKRMEAERLARLPGEDRRNVEQPVVQK